MFMLQTCSVSMDSLLEGTTLFTAGGCGHCSLGNQFSVQVRGAPCGFLHGSRLLQCGDDGLGKAVVGGRRWFR